MQSGFRDAPAGPTRLGFVEAVEKEGENVCEEDDELEVGGGRGRRARVGRMKRRRKEGSCGWNRDQEGERRGGI